MLPGKPTWGPNEGATVLTRVVDTRGYLAADLQPPDPDDARDALLDDAADGVEVVMGDIAPLVQAAKLDDLIAAGRHGPRRPRRAGRVGRRRAAFLARLARRSTPRPALASVPGAHVRAASTTTAPSPRGAPRARPISSGESASGATSSSPTAPSSASPPTAPRSGASPARRRARTSRSRFTSSARRGSLKGSTVSRSRARAASPSPPRRSASAPRRQVRAPPTPPSIFTPSPTTLSSSWRIRAPLRRPQPGTTTPKRRGPCPLAPCPLAPCLLAP